MKENLNLEKVELKNPENLKKDIKCHNKKNRFFLKIFLYPIYIFFVVFLFLFILKLFFPSLYFDVNRKIEDFINKTNLNSFVSEKFDGFKKWLHKKKEVANENEDYKQQKELEKEAGEKVENVEKIKTVFEEDSIPIEDGDDVIFFNFKQPLKGKISSKYGFREDPLGKKQNKDFHYGVDISVRDGTPIVAIADGIVNRTAKSEKSGNFIFIKHGEKYESLYAHCSKILVPAGRSVKQGETVALSGRSGNVTGAHLHFGLKENGKWVDPLNVFPNLL